MSQYYRFPFRPFDENEKVDLLESIKTHVHFLILNSFKRTSPFLDEYHFNLKASESNAEWETKVRAGIKKYENRLSLEKVKCSSKGKLSLKVHIKGTVMESGDKVAFDENFLITHR